MKPIFRLLPVLVSDVDQPVQSAAVRALGAAGPVAKKHLQEVVEFFLDDPAVPPFGAAETVLQISPLNPQELTSLLYPLYVYPDLTTLTRATAYGSSGGDTDGLLIVSLLGRSRVPAKDVVDPANVNQAVTVLEESLKAPLMHDTLKAEIEGHIAEIKSLH